MRKVTQDIARAFVNGQKKTVSNTSTDGMSVWLHGHEIIRKTGNKEFRISLCGWGTPTTRERLNGILSFAGSEMHTCFSIIMNNSFALMVRLSI